MEPTSVIYLSGLITGIIVGDATDPLGIHDTNVDKTCVVKTITDKSYNFEIKDYIENTSKVETCTITTKEK